MDRVRIRRTVLREGVRVALAVRDAVHTVHAAVREEYEAERRGPGTVAPASGGAAAHEEPIVDASTNKLILKGLPGGMAVGQFRLACDANSPARAVTVMASDIIDGTGQRRAETLDVQPAELEVLPGTDEIVTLSVELPDEIQLGQQFGHAKIRVSTGGQHQNIAVLVLADLV
jgi:hypothetical protein